MIIINNKREGKEKEKERGGEWEDILIQHLSQQRRKGERERERGGKKKGEGRERGGRRRGRGKGRGDYILKETSMTKGEEGEGGERRRGDYILKETSMTERKTTSLTASNKVLT